MTVIAVRKLKSGKIEMSADSQVTHGDYKQRHSDSKVFKVNGMLVGGAGNVSESNLFKIFCKNHKPKNSECDSIIEFMFEFREWVAKKVGDEDYRTENQYVLVFDNKIFDIDEGNVDERNDFWATGSGMYLALSALHFDKSTKEAVEVAKIYDLYCGGETITERT